MRLTNIGNHKTIDGYVKEKFDRFTHSERSFATLFHEMFSEEGNIFFEKSAGYKIEKTTYGEAKIMAKKTASALKEKLQGAEKDCVVGIYMDNCLQWILVFWAILLCGARPLLMNKRLDRDTLENVLSDLDCRLVVTDSEPFSVKSVNYKELNSDEEIEEGDFGTELFVMSSGTSSNVKICVYTPEEIFYQIMDSSDIITKCSAMKTHYKGELKLLTFLPFYHIFGFTAMYTWFAFFQRSFVHLPDMAPDTILNTIRRHEVTHIFAVPLFWDKVYTAAMTEIKGRGEKTYNKFLKGLEISGKIAGLPLLSELFKKSAFREVRDGLFGESISILITGGSEIRGEVLSFFNGIGYHMTNGYGMSEIGITCVELSSDNKLLTSGSVGEPLSSAQFKISDDGELLCRSKAAARFIIEKGTRKNIGEEEWFNTHDLAREEKGHYYILGRRDDLVITPNGENLNPNLIEGKIGQPACLIYDKNASRAVLLVSVSRFVTAEDLGEISMSVSERLAELRLSSQIGQITFVAGPLMKEDEFKLNRSRIRRDYESGALPIVTPENARVPEEDDEISERVKRCFARATAREESTVYSDTDFFVDLGGTSLDYFAMCREMQSEFGFPISQGTEASMTKVSEFCEYIRSRM